jgi:betaine-homocysteine S-methyltransferase
MARSVAEALNQGPVICGEGYLFELERRGYLQAGSFVPEVSLEYPEVLAAVHRDFVRAGSDVIQAFTYNAHREKMRIIGKEHLLEPLNRAALRIAAEVKNEFSEPLFLAGNISNTNIYEPDDPTSEEAVRAMFREMIGWSAEAGVDFIIGETFYYHREAEIALEEIKAAGYEAVITLGIMASGALQDGWTLTDSCRALEQKGADVVGLNCFRGPETMLPLIREIRNAVSCHVGALPVTYRTTEEEPTFFKLQDHHCSVCSPNGRPFPEALDPLYINRYEAGEFARQAYAEDIRYLGLCCGATPAFLREMSEAVGKTAINSKYSPNMEKHFLYGSDSSLKQHIRDLGGGA